MAATAGEGVVNTDDRVHGIDDLYVTDGSTLLTQGSANPALAAALR